MRSAIDVKLSSISGSNRLPSSSSACVMRSLSSELAIIVCHLNLCRNQEYQDHRACQTIRELRARPNADSATSISTSEYAQEFRGKTDNLYTICLPKYCNERSARCLRGAHRPLVGEEVVLAGDVGREKNSRTYPLTQSGGS